MVVVVFLITYVSIVIGELVPKTIALNNAEKMAIAVASPIQVVSIIFYPFVNLLAVSTSFVTKLIGLKPKNEVVSEMELRAMLRLPLTRESSMRKRTSSTNRYSISPIKGLFNLMTHRTDVEWVDISKSREEVIHDLLQTKHSKILACKKKIDEFIGTSSRWRDFLLRLNNGEPFTIEELIMEPIIVPNTLRAQKVLENFKTAISL